MEETPPSPDRSRSPDSESNPLEEVFAPRKFLAFAGTLVVGRSLPLRRLQLWMGASRRRTVLSAAIAAALFLLLLELWQLLFIHPVPATPLELGRQLYNSGHYTASAQQLRQELSSHPRETEARFLLAQNLIALQQWPAANAALDELLKSAPNDPWVYYWLGQLQLGDNRPNDAAASWQLILSRTDPAAQAVKPGTQLALGSLRFQQGAYDEASRLLYEGIANNNGVEAIQLQQAYYQYGLLLARDLRFDDAVSTLQRAMNVSLPGNQWENARLHLQQNNLLDKAQTLLTHLPEAAGEKVEGARRAKLAYAFILAEEYRPAEEQLLQVLRAAPSYADARAYLGIIYWRTGKTDRAVSTLNAALALSPSSRLARQALAELLIDKLSLATGQTAETDGYKQDSERARILLESLVNERPDDAALQVTMARYYIARHDYQHAQQYYENAIALNKSHPVQGLNPQATLSRFYSETAFDPCVRGVDAGLDATKAQPDDPESWYAAGQAYSLCGHPSLAVPMYEKALELRQYWPDALYHLGQAYDTLKRKADADRVFSLLADLDPTRVFQRQQ
ncbi:MAG TPA: tetratricopeptide repeat protein [Chloroflexia bacterium]|nr:tetratricopeptide repeat protein [Chloroflexia bacterium]